MQEEAFLENVKDLEERASRAEVMYGGENASREVSASKHILRGARSATQADARWGVSHSGIKTAGCGMRVRPLHRFGLNGVDRLTLNTVLGLFI